MEHDTQILKGIDALINMDELKEGVDLRAIERELINETPQYDRDDAARQINETIQKMSQQYGFDASEIIGDVAQNDYSVRSPQPRSPTARSPQPRSPIARSPAARSPQFYNARNTPTVFDHQEQSPAELYSREPVYRDDPDVLDEDAELLQEEEKAMMLANIEQILASLESDGVDVSRYRNEPVTQNSAARSVKSRLHLLQTISDRSRCSTIAEELIIFGVVAMEELFNGKTEYLGYKPDLTGYSNTARVKLRRVRPVTGSLASSFVKDYSMGPGLQLLLELIPSAILYSRQRRNQHGQPGVFDDASMVETNSKLNKFK